MSTARELSELCGQLLVVGFPGTTLDDETRRALRERRRAGVILFKRNVESLPAVHALCADVARTAEGDEGVFISVDQEGGRVRRIPAPAVQLPPMRTIGDIDDTDLARRVGGALGAELLAMGFNVDFAPVLDVNSNPNNPIIGDRSFGRSAARVGELGAALVDGLQSSGVMACAKHFPGHGDTDVDSHLDLPHVSHPRVRLDEIELVPFRRVAATVGSIMTAHIVFDALDPGVPATLSPRVVTDLLRRELGFGGLVFSDDLEMRALADRFTVEECAVGAVRAGCDVLLVCEHRDLADRAHVALIQEAERNPVFRARCHDSAARSRALRRRYPARPAPSEEALMRAVSESGAEALLAEVDSRKAAPLAT